MNTLDFFLGTKPTPPKRKILCPPKNQPKHDLVFTPRSLAREIIEHFPLHGKLLDPCRGDGAFYDYFPEHCETDWCEITQDRDFFDYDEHVDWIVTNPPWSRIREFLEHGMEIADNIVFLVQMVHVCTKARLRAIRDSGFAFKEFYSVPTPPSPWPQCGFQVAAIHIARGWKGSTLFSGELG
jgi:hypothetical protein